MANSQAIRVETAGREDWPRVQQLLREASLTPEGIGDDVDVLFVARGGGEAVGAAAVELHGQQALLRSVVVEPALRSAGVGERLVRESIVWATRAGATELWLLTIDAERYFERFGFRIIDRAAVAGPVLQSAEFTSLCPATAIAMKLDLERSN